jgi:hypothetical protein
MNDNNNIYLHCSIMGIDPKLLNCAELNHTGIISKNTDYEQDRRLFETNY